jgi:hypothetical protein
MTFYEAMVLLSVSPSAPLVRPPLRSEQLREARARLRCHVDPGFSRPVKTLVIRLWPGVKPSRLQFQTKLQPYHGTASGTNSYQGRIPIRLAHSR